MTRTHMMDETGVDGAISGRLGPTPSLSLPPTNLKLAARPPTERSPADTIPGAGVDSTDLVIVFDDGSGVTITWHLTCRPTGGTHPTPDVACRALAEHGDEALPPVPEDMRCTMIFGGPQRAQITGRWRGRPVDSTLSRQNGCEIARWDLLVGLVPAGGS